MGMVAAICTQCGAAIEVDESKEAGICSHCGTAFITEKVINNYTIHNHNTVNNNIAHATINVKKGDDAEDEVKRYRAFIKQKKYVSAVNLLDKMEEKFPDSGLTQYCKADFYLTAVNYPEWLEDAENGANDELDDDGIPCQTANDFFGKDCVFDDCIFDLKSLSAALDKFEAISDGEMRDRINRRKVNAPGISPKYYSKKEFKTINTEYKVRELIWNCVAEVRGLKLDRMFCWNFHDYECEPHYNNCIHGYDIGKNYDKDYLYDRDEYDEETIDTDKYSAIEDLRKADTVGYKNSYKRALFYAEKSMEFGDSLMTDSERERNADFLREVGDKYEEFAAVTARREIAKQRIIAVRDELREKYRKPLEERKNGFFPSKSHYLKKFFGKALVAVILIGIAVGVAVFVIKKFL